MWRLNSSSLVCRLAGWRHRKLHGHFLPQRRRPACECVDPLHRRRDTSLLPPPPPHHSRHGDQTWAPPPQPVRPIKLLHGLQQGGGRSGRGLVVSGKMTNQIHRHQRRQESCDWTSQVSIKWKPVGGFQLSNQKTLFYFVATGEEHETETSCLDEEPPIVFKAETRLDKPPR